MKKAFTLVEGATHVALLNKKLLFGFTLAEVLITLGIIGVVAACTMPTLIQNHQKKTTVNKLKNTYNILTNAIEFAKNEYGLDVNEWYFPDVTDKKVLSDYFAEHYLIPYLKIAKDCNPYVPNECLPSNHSNERIFILSNGAIISVSVSGEENLRVQINMYINGYKKVVNRARDVFMVELGGGSGNVGLDKNKILPYGYSIKSTRSAYTNRDDTSCNKTGTKMRCFALIMYDGWRISDDYPW